MTGRRRLFLLAGLGLISAGCGGQATLLANNAPANATLLVTSTLNDQFAMVPMQISAITLGGDSGASAGTPLLTFPAQFDAQTLNGELAPLASAAVSLPPGTYTTASISYTGSAVCYGVSDLGGIYGAFLSLPGQTVSASLPQPITIAAGSSPAIQLAISGIAPAGGASCSSVQQSMLSEPVFTLTTLPSPAGGTRVLAHNQIAEVIGSGSQSFELAPSTGINGLPLPYSFDAGAPWLLTSTPGTTETVGAVVDVDLTQSAAGLQATRMMQLGGLGTPGYNAVLVGPVVNTYSKLALPNLVPGTDSSTNFQISAGFVPPSSLSFGPVFSASSIVPGQRVVAFSDGGQPPTFASVTLEPQVIDAQVNSVQTAGNYTVYTVQLAPYDMISTLATLPNANPESDPTTVQVYVSSSTATSVQPSSGDLARFDGYLFDDGGVLRMFCTQISSGVPF